jgi:hypothetical protein
MAHHFYAGVAELADALDLGSSAARRGGSSPSTRTKLEVGSWKLEKISILTSNNLS